MSLRQLTSGDEPRLDAFLASHMDSSMFLRANARQAGLVYRGESDQALYAAAFRGDVMIGVVAHCGNGMVLVQAPAAASELAAACVEWSGRGVTGLAGPAEQVPDVRSALKLEERVAAVEGNDWLYALDLAELIVPMPLENGAVVCRAPRPDERDTLCDWRLAYDIELLGATDTPEHRDRAAAFLDAQIAESNAWVAVEEDVPVSLSAFNAALPDIVQIGGVYTPPELRGRGFAKVSVAGSLIAGRERGASRAVLFTSNPSAARAYEALGFRRVGDYSLVLFR